MRSVPDPGFPGDDGSVPPQVQVALQAVSEGAPVETLLAALCGSRVLVPVVAVAGEVEHDERGPAREKTADMAAVLLTGRDGRQALLAFTGTDSLRAWDPDARPVPVTTAQAAQAALAEGAAALVVDVAGPVQVPVEGDDLRHVAAGHALVPAGDGWAWVQPVDPPDQGGQGSTAPV
jgi:hypothetical protein